MFVNAAQFSEKVEGSSVESMSLADFRSWCSLVPSARKFLGSLLMPPDSGLLFIPIYIFTLVTSMYLKQPSFCLGILNHTELFYMFPILKLYENY